MGERAKMILNEYSARELLKRDTLDLDKFYTADLKIFIEVARKENKRLNNIINELEKWLKEEYEATVFDYHNAIEDVLNKLQELKGE